MTSLPDYPAQHMIQRFPWSAPQSAQPKDNLAEKSSAVYHTLRSGTVFIHRDPDGIFSNKLHGGNTNHDSGFPRIVSKRYSCDTNTLPQHQRQRETQPRKKNLLYSPSLLSCEEPKRPRTRAQTKNPGKVEPVTIDSGYDTADSSTGLESSKSDVQATPIDSIQKPENVIPGSSTVQLSWTVGNYSAGSTTRHRNQSPAKTKRRVKTVKPPTKSTAKRRLAHTYARHADKRIEQETQIAITKAIQKGEISFSHLQKSEKQMLDILIAILTSLPQQRHEMKEFKLRNCGVTTKVLETIASKAKQVNVAMLDLSGNKNLDIKAVKELMDTLNSEALDLSDAELNEEQITNLAKIPLKILKLNYSSFTNDSISDALVKLINNGLEELSLIDSSITNPQLERISKQMINNASLRILDLSHVSLGSNGIRAVAGIVRKAKEMDRLVLSDCDLTTDLLINLGEETESEIAKLDVSSNPELVNGDINVVAVLADKVGCQELDLSSNMLTGEHIEQLATERRPKNITSLRLGENQGVSSSAVGRLVVAWNLKGLDLSECRQHPTALEELDKSLDSYKELQWLDISDPLGLPSKEKVNVWESLSRKTGELLCGNHKPYPQIN